MEDWKKNWKYTLYLKKYHYDTFIFFTEVIMILFFVFILFIFGSLFWSFSSVIIYRLRSGESGTLTGRSHCPKCHNTLRARHLIPIFSYIFQKGKCSFCLEKIPLVYPLLELSSGIIFASFWYFLIDPFLIFSWDIFEISRLLFFLVLWFLTLIYVWYDILFLEIPESILLSANILVFAGLIFQWFWYMLFPYFPVGGLDVYDIIISLGVLSLLYTIFLAGLREIYDVGLMIFIGLLIWGYMYFFEKSYHDSALISGTLGTFFVYLSFFVQIVLSGWRAMWAGDLRIAILMGLIVGISFAFPAWMICYLIGSIVGIWIIIIQKIQKPSEKILHQIPFWPFIASGYIAILLFYFPISQFIGLYF